MKQVLSFDQLWHDPGERSLTLEEFASLPWPSDEQFEAFVEHVCDAHSWYKHLPLREGSEFTFYLASDAGDGYTEDSPRLHHTWKTTQEYRHRFGFLDYSESGSRDAGAKLTLPPEIVEATKTVLFPYVCKHENAIDACLWNVHEEFIQHLLTHGAQSPSDHDALRWYSSQKRFESTPLTEAECEQVLAIRWYSYHKPLGSEPVTKAEYEQRVAIEDAQLESMPKDLIDDAVDEARARREAMSAYWELQAKGEAKAIENYFRTEQKTISTYYELQGQEEAKIRGALARLRVLHQQLGGTHSVP